MNRLEQTRRVGLARALSKAGYCSRSQAERLIRAGRVQLNDKVRRDPEQPVTLTKDTIKVDGQGIQAAEKIYFILNKPRGLVTTTSDEKGRATVYSVMGADAPWVSPVGRLDKASEGLLLMTNDSEWAAQILAPESRVAKIYHVQISGIIDTKIVQQLIVGFRVRNGDFLAVKNAAVIRGGERNTWLEIALEEGKNRHIRRMFEQLGIEVLRLVRVAIGPITLGDLPKGKTRQLTAAEKTALDAMTARRSPKRRPSTEGL